jgi:hypothetical protein
MYAAKIFSNPPQEVKPSTNIAVLEIVCVITGNVFSMAVGILSLVFYNDTIVKNYFASLNGTIANGPASAAPQTPASIPHPEVAPIIEEPNLREDEETSVPPVENPETPDKPKQVPPETEE